VIRKAFWAGCRSLYMRGSIGETRLGKGMATIMGWCSGRVKGMVKALRDGFQGRPHPLRGLQTLLIGFIYWWSLNYLALLGSLFLLPLLPRIIHAIAELTYAPIAWRL
jgi:hypothetical protein